MKTIPQSIRSVNDRRSQQCAWSMAEYGIADQPDMVALVLEHLPTQTPDAIDRLKREWLNDPCFFLEDTEGFEVHREELIEFRLTHTAWATAQAHEAQGWMAWEWRVTEEAAARIEAKRLIAQYQGWMGTPIDHKPRQVAALAQALVQAATPPPDMSKDQFPCSSPEWTTLAKLELAEHDTRLEQEMAVHRTECWQPQNGESTR
ncbi:MAG: hypothetical protein K8963_10690 [Proteobacteria bacterium]|nr:hypothetical protein [Pseudomonadota bacterium]